jgi:outer membrane biosynthesis protein TonB
MNMTNHKIEILCVLIILGLVIFSAPISGVERTALAKKKSSSGDAITPKTPIETPSTTPNPSSPNEQTGIPSSGDGSGSIPNQISPPTQPEPTIPQPEPTIPQPPSTTNPNPNAESQPQTIVPESTPIDKGVNDTTTTPKDIETANVTNPLANQITTEPITNSTTPFTNNTSPIDNGTLPVQGVNNQTGGGSGNVTNNINIAIAVAVQNIVNKIISPGGGGSGGSNAQVQVLIQQLISLLVKQEQANNPNTKFVELQSTPINELFTNSTRLGSAVRIVSHAVFVDQSTGELFAKGVVKNVGRSTIASVVLFADEFNIANHFIQRTQSAPNTIPLKPGDSFSYNIDLKGHYTGKFDSRAIAGLTYQLTAKNAVVASAVATR